VIKNLSVKAVWCTKTVESEFPDKGQKLVSIDSLRKRIRKHGTIIVQQPGSGRPCSAHSAGGPCAQMTSQKGTDQLVRFRMKLPFSVQMYTGSP